MSVLPRSRTAASDVTVLLADDEPALRGALAELLSHEEGVRLIGEAADADEAIEVAQRELPDVALVDVKMPAGGGARAAREIQRLSPSTRVIALSAFEDRATVLEMIKAGAVGYLVKGATADEIVGSIRTVASGGTSMSHEVVEGIVHELSSQLRREEIERAEKAALIDEIYRFLGGHGLSIAFQPIIELDSWTVAGYEALARFHSIPMRGPAEWFAQAGALDLSIPLELAAIRMALDGLPRLPPDAYLSVNASHRVAGSPELRDLLEGIGTRMVVEITEHEAVEDYVQLSGALSELRRSGVRIAIDDAGAGFASLRHALQLSPDIVKVDISLTKEIDIDRGRRALASALVAFADEMGMTIVAEGIERGSELKTLRELGVRYAQGYYLAEPRPLSGIERGIEPVDQIRLDPSPAGRSPRTSPPFPS